MKKILLASTMLVGTAGVAAAQVSFSGSAYMGVGSPNGGATWTALFNASVDVAMSGETDGGLAFGADFTINAGGRGIGSAAGHVTFASATYLSLGTATVTTTLGATATFIPGTLTAALATGSAAFATTTSGPSVGTATVWISGDFGKVSLGGSLTNPSLGYEGTFGDFTVELSYGTVSRVWDGQVTWDNGTYSAYLGYNSAAQMNNLHMDVYAPVLPPNMVTNANLTVPTLRVGGSASFGDFTVTADVQSGAGPFALPLNGTTVFAAPVSNIILNPTDSGAIAVLDWKLGASYSSGAITAGGYIGFTSAAVAVPGSGGAVALAAGYGRAGLSASYDLGGGASIDFAWDDPMTAVAGNESIKLGISMDF